MANNVNTTVIGLKKSDENITTAVDNKSTDTKPNSTPFLHVRVNATIHVESDN